MRSYVLAAILVLAGSACTESLTAPDVATEPVLGAPARSLAPRCVFVDPGVGRVEGNCGGANSDPPPAVFIDGKLVNEQGQ